MTSTSLEKVIDGIKKTLKWLVIATVVLYLATAGLGLLTYNAAQENHQALCSLRAGHVTKVHSSNHFLHQHPHGIQGIPASVIRQSIADETKIIESLNGLSC